MLEKLEHALSVTEKAREDGTLTSSEGVWVLAAWVATLAYIVEELTNPYALVDKEKLTTLLIASWHRVRTILDSLQLPVTVRWGLRFLKGAIEEALPDVAQDIADYLDSGEKPD